MAHMRRGEFGPIRAALIGIGWGIVAAWGAGAGRAGEVTLAPQPPAQGSVPSDGAIIGAARAGRLDEALRLIREQAGNHPEWAPPRVILARLLFAGEQAPAGRRVLEQAAVELPDHPDVYLSF